MQEQKTGKEGPLQTLMSAIGQRIRGGREGIGSAWHLTLQLTRSIWYKVSRAKGVDLKAGIV